MPAGAPTPSSKRQHGQRDFEAMRRAFGLFRAAGVAAALAALPRQSSGRPLGSISAAESISS